MIKRIVVSCAWRFSRRPFRPGGILDRIGATEFARHVAAGGGLNKAVSAPFVTVRYSLQASATCLPPGIATPFRQTPAEGNAPRYRYVPKLVSTPLPPCSLQRQPHGSRAGPSGRAIYRRSRRKTGMQSVKHLLSRAGLAGHRNKLPLAA
jgi:hypothetical protein